MEVFNFGSQETWFMYAWLQSWKYDFESEVADAFERLDESDASTPAKLKREIAMSLRGQVLERWVPEWCELRGIMPPASGSLIAVDGAPAAFEMEAENNTEHSHRDSLDTLVFAALGTTLDRVLWGNLAEAILRSCGKWAPEQP